MRVCFVGPNAGPLFLPHSRTSFGGMELRAKVLAEGLSRRPGFEVHFAVQAPAAKGVTRVGDIHVHELALERPDTFLNRAADQAHLQVERTSSFPGWRATAPTPHLLWQFPLMVLRDGLWRIYEDTGRPWIGREVMAVAADAYCCFGLHRLAADVALAARRAGRACLLFLASDAELGPHIYRRSRQRGRLRHLGHPAYVALHAAHRIVVQNEHQRQTLKTMFGLDGVCIRNPIDLERTAPGPSPLQHPYAFWIGRADSDVKRPRLCIALARACPQLHFLMIVNPGHGLDQASLRAEAPANVTLIDYVPPDDVERYFRHARLLVNTSAFEGFPNAFLQAAKYGVPVASLQVDPDGMLAQHHCGIAAAGVMEVLAQAVTRLASDDAAHAAASQAALRYVRTYHDLAGRIDELADLLRQLAPTTPPPSPVADA